MSDIETYRQLLKAHDWEYQRSDDRTAYRKGEAERRHLDTLAAQIDPLYAAWNELAPEGYRRKVAATLPKLHVPIEETEIARLNRLVNLYAGRCERLKKAMKSALEDQGCKGTARIILRNALDLENTLDTVKKGK